jgi:PAS domain S-box-containing protein
MMKVENNLLQQRISKKNRLAYITPLYSLLFSISGLLIVTLAYFRVRKEINLRYEAEKNAFESQQQHKLSKESENRLLNFADNVPVMIWLCDNESSCYFFNSQWLDFTGRTLEQEKGRGWMQNIHPEDLETYNDTFRFSFEQRRIFFMEYRLKKADNNYRWLSVKGVPRYDSNHVFMGYAAGCMDIEEQKNFSIELEKKVTERTLELKNLNGLLQIKNDIFAYAEENARLGSYSWNLQTGELEYSDNLFRMFGYQPREFEPSFEKFVTLIHPDDREQVIADGEKTYTTKVLVANTYRVITKQGEIKYFRSNGNFIGDEKEFLVGSVQDITKDSMLTDTLTQKNLELERNNEELESFTYIASHDLQEPLRKIQSFSKILLDQEAENFSERGRDYFLRVISAAARMQHLIESLLNYSRVNMSEVKFVPTDLNAVLEEVKQNLFEKLAEKKAVIESSVLPNLNVMPMHFYQLFSNLIINSLKYSKAQEPPFIIISSSVVSGADIMLEGIAKRKRFWKLVFEDNGIGFEPQYEQKIFELFQRLHGRTEYEGTGIGLAICKKIVHNHNGYITAKGNPGVGASFVIYLPVEN